MFNTADTVGTVLGSPELIRRIVKKVSCLALAELLAVFSQPRPQVFICKRQYFGGQKRRVLRAVRAEPDGAHFATVDVDASRARIEEQPRASLLFEVHNRIIEKRHELVICDLVPRNAKIILRTADLDVSPGEVTPEATFFHDGLGLDSIDILELVVAIEERWNVKIDNRELGEKVFACVGALVDYIEKNRPTA